MSVKIVPKFTKADIRKMLEARKQLILDKITERLQKIGETFVTNAKNNGTMFLGPFLTSGYKDHTGNLRSSIGYVILYNGAQLNSKIEGEAEGVRFAKKAIADISLKYPSGFVLIGVAGMDYAAAVESKGFDVISNSATIAAIELRNAMKRFQQSLNS